MEVTALTELRFERTMVEVRRALDLGRRLDARAQELDRALSDAIAGAPDARHRGRFLDLRRSVRRRRRLRPEGDEADRLGPELASRLQGWVAELDALVTVEVAGERVREAEWLEKREALRRTAGREPFLQGLALASADLHADLRKWLAAPRPAPRAARNLEIGLLMYLGRMVAKTSPYSTFTSSLVGRWEREGGPLVPPPGGWERQSVLELNRELTGRLLEELARWPVIRRGLDARINPTAQSDAQHVRFLSWNSTTGERLRRVRTTVEFDALMRAVDAPGERTCPAALSRAQADLPDADPSELEALLDELVEMGLVETSFGLPEQEPDQLRPLVSRLEAVDDEGVRAVLAPLRELSSLLTELEAGGPASTRAELLERLRDAAGRAVGMSGLDQCGYRLPSKNLVYENSVVLTPGLSCSESAWRPALEDLGRFQRLLGLYEPRLPAQLALAAHFAERYGPGSAVALLDFYRALHEDARDAAGANRGGRHPAVILQALANPYLPGGLEVPELEEVDRLKAALPIWLESQPVAPDLSRRLDPALLDGLLSELPPYVRIPRSVAYYCQPLLDSDRPRLVLNTLHSGFGRSIGRTRHLLTRATGSPAPSASDPPANGPLRVEVQGVFHSTLGLRSAQTRHEIEYPGCMEPRPDAERVSLRDLQVVHDPGARRLRLVSARIGRELLPVHQSLMVSIWLPPLYRFLITVFGEGPLDPFVNLRVEWSPVDELGPAVRPHPRLWLGDILVDRAWWTVDRDALPARTAGETEFRHLVRVHRWLEEHDIPSECFVRSQPVNQPAQTVEQFVALMQRGRKPIHVDFRSCASLLTLERALRAGPHVVFEEAVPSLAQAALTDGADRYVSELVFELDLDH